MSQTYYKPEAMAKVKAKGRGHHHQDEFGPSITTGIPTDDMIRDAIRRNSADRSITAWVFNDPPPGCSALDRKRQ